MSTLRRRLDAPSPRLAAEADPLELLDTDHARQRALCAELLQLAEGGPLDRARLPTALAGLGPDREAHVADEEEGLFPLLLVRAAPEDDAPRLLARLRAEHSTIGQTVAAARAALRRLAEGATLDEEGREALVAHSELKRRHLTLENAVLMPLARLRLRIDDRVRLLAGMTARRGLVMEFAH